MKKAKGTKTLSFIIAFVLVVTLVLGVLGGSVSSASSSLRKENAKLKQQIEQVQKDNKTLQDSNSKLTNDNNSLKDKNSLLESDKTTLQEEISNMYNYQYSLNIDFYVDSTLYISGKARNGGTLLVSPTEPTKSGYNFKGWSKTENGEVIDLATTIFTTNTSLYAVFEKEPSENTETWVLNEYLTSFGSKGWSYNINFISNSENYSTFVYDFVDPLNAYLLYGSNKVYDIGNGVWLVDNLYRTITFDSPITDETLLDWLEVNGTRQ